MLLLLLLLLFCCCNDIARNIGNIIDIAVAVCRLQMENGKYEFVLIKFDKGKPFKIGAQSRPKMSFHN